MYEKTAEVHLRLEKTDKVREKISREITKYSGRHRRWMSELGAKYVTEGLSEEETLQWNDLIRKEYALLELSKFLENPECFNRMEMIGHGVTVYTIAQDTLDIWLSEEYSFVASFLFHVMEDNVPVDAVLTCRYLEHDFVLLFDRIAHNEKKQEERE